MIITRDGDFFVFHNGERVPAFTSLSDGTVLEWTLESRTQYQQLGTWHGQRVLSIHHDGAWIVEMASTFSVYDGASGTESTVILAQRRCVKVLEALLGKMEE